MYSYLILIISVTLFILSLILFFISYYSKKKLLKKLHRFIDDAINEKFNEELLDETMVSALESKFSKYLRKNSLKQIAIEEERKKIKSLISDISHQTKTPVANIILYSSLLKEKLIMDDELNFIISEIEKQGEKLNFFINTLIKTSRLEAGIIKLKPINNSTLNLVEDVIASVNIKAEKKNIKIINFLEDEIINFDMRWTVEALYNVIENAVKYTDDFGTIEIKNKSYEFFYRIDIKDNGRGIAKEDINKIFNRFYRAEEVSQIEGIGIGLFLAREIINAEGGYIKVSSLLGEGTTFSLFLSKRKF